MTLLIGLALVCLVDASPAGAQEEGEGPTVTFTVRDRKGNSEPGDDELVEGATITIVDSAGAEVAVIETDAEGKATVELPAAGQFTATLDVDALPEGIGGPREGGEVLQIDPNRARVATFTLGDRQRVERTFTDEVKQTTIDGIRFGLVIAMCSVGLSLIFGTTGLTNFAHGEIVTLGAIVTWFMVNDHGVNLILAAVLALMITGGFGGGLDRFLWRPLRQRGLSLLSMMVVSIGLAFFMRYFFQIWFGRDSTPYSQYSVGRTSTYEVWGVRVSATTIAAIIISLVVLISVGLLLQRTRTGKAMRAVADNPDLAASSGINVDRIVALVWAFGAALASVGGVLHGLSEEVKFDFGNDILLLMFAGVVLGGLGTAYGALVGGFVVGMLVQMSTLWIDPNLKVVAALAVLILVLLVRPQGILGRAERVG